MVKFAALDEAPYWEVFDWNLCENTQEVFDWILCENTQENTQKILWPMMHLSYML